MNTETELLAETLATADFDFIWELVQRRMQQGVTPTVLSERIGWTTAQLFEFESYWHDPKLSEIRRYAFGLGLTYSHSLGALIEGDKP